jgi:mono/diheme cytochrome c family protein
MTARSLTAGAVARVAAAAALTLSAGVACGETERELVARGQKLFTEQGCHGCHTVGKMGTPIAKDLSTIGATHDRTHLEKWLRDPAAQRPTAHMPRLDLRGAEITALAAYLASLR